MSAATYPVGTPVLYGRTGVCRVEGVGTPPFRKNDGQLYYTLGALFSSSGELIYIPVDASVSMRPLIGGGEAVGYLEQLPQLKPKIPGPRKPADLTAHYQELLASRDLTDCLLLLKEIFLKQKEYKKLGQIDQRYQKVAERMVCEEFAVALGTAPDAIRKRLYAAMEREAAS